MVNKTLPIDFSNTKVAFAYKSDEELKKSAFLLRIMNNSTLVSLGSTLVTPLLWLRLPFVKSLVKKTIFWQFCGGTTLLESLPVIQKLFQYKVTTTLQYGVEAKSDEQSFNHTMNEVIRAIEFAGRNPGITAVAVKLTGIADYDFLEYLHARKPLTKEHRQEYRKVIKRLDAICYIAAQKGIIVYIDAEESWIQYPLDRLVTLMMKRYNREKAIVYNTFQMYRKSRLQFLIDSYNLAKKQGYILGAKLVRGAYVEKERERAHALGYESPIHETKAAVDDAYDTALRFCLDNYRDLAFCNASHNENSNQLLAELMLERDIRPDHPHIIFNQLYGMSDNLTFNLAKAGFNAAKYVNYGPVKEVIPFLMRRARENTSITGDVSREYRLIKKELERRRL